MTDPRPPPDQDAFSPSQLPKPWLTEWQAPKTAQQGRPMHERAVQLFISLPLCFSARRTPDVPPVRQQQHLQP